MSSWRRPIRRPLTSLALVSCALCAAPASLAQAQTSAAGKGPDFSVTEGLRYQGGPLSWHLGGLLAADWVEYDSHNTRDSGPRVDLAHLIFDGSYQDTMSWYIAADLEGTDTRYNLDEAYGSILLTPGLRLTLGLIDIPLGVEASIREEDLSFVGYGFPIDLDGRTDWAARLEGELREGFFSYDLALAAGAGFDRFGQSKTDPQLSGRITVYPFRWDPAADRLIDGLFGAVAVSYTPEYHDELDVATPLHNKVYNLPDLRADGSFYWHVSAGWDAGSVRVMAETMRGSLYDLRTPVGKRDIEGEITSWQASISWMISGERYDTRPFRQRQGREDFPRQPLVLDGGQGGWGAFEIGYRYGNGDIAREFENFGLTTRFIVSQEFRTHTLVVNWYPTAQTRLSFQVVDTNADDDPATFEGRSTDTSFLLRAQYRF